VKKRALTVLLAAAVVALSGRGAVRAACSAPANPIEAENCLPGTPRAEWDLGIVDNAIEGFPVDVSVNRGERIDFKVRSPAPFRAEIFRLGYYNGSGARRVATVAAAGASSQPACLTDGSTGLIDCGNWSVSASWTVPPDAASGVYWVRFIRSDTGTHNITAFVVRDDSSRSDVLFQTSDTRWHAYNEYGGNSLYRGNPSGRAFKVSYNRPYLGRCIYELLDVAQPMIQFLERNGYDVTYFAGVDTDRRGELLKNHKVYLSVGHDEYWSGAQRDHVEAARDAGVHLAFFSGNAVYWKTRWEPSLDAARAPHRTLVCYKETTAKLDPAPVWTGRWRDPRFSPPNDGGRPENALMGTIFTVDATRNDPLTVRAEHGRLRFWRRTRVADLPPGESVAFPEILGYEWDEDLANGHRPAGLIRLSSSTFDVPSRLNENHMFGPGRATHHLTLYRHTSGALVFGAGTMQWSWGLSNEHMNGTRRSADPVIQQATVNLLADMDVQPASLQAGLVRAERSDDFIPPVSAVSAAEPVSGGRVAVSGTASDVGGRVAAVEVSLDGGLSWHAAFGQENWTYTGPGSPEAARSRAVDDSGNLEGRASGLLVSSAEPDGAEAGGPAMTVTLKGSGFMPGAVARWNGSERPTAFVSTGTLQAQISATDIAARGFAEIAVANPGGTVSRSLRFPVRLIPAIDRVVMEPAPAGLGLRIIGRGFAEDSVVRWNGSDQKTLFRMERELRAEASAENLPSEGPSRVEVTVFNPEPGGASKPIPVLIGPDFGRSVRAYPNPWRADRDAGTGVWFDGLAPGSRIEIYTLTGRRVTALDAATGSVEWRVTNDDNQTVEPGYYFFVVTGPGGEQRGRLIVLR
jgi:hypothetical protein